MAEVKDTSVDDVDLGIKRTYRKKSDSHSRKASHNPGIVSVRVQLNKLSDKDIADAKMASVFGDSASTTQSTKTPLRVNPLYEKNGTLEVPANELRRKRPGSDAGSIASTSTRTSIHAGGHPGITNNLNHESVNTVSQNVAMNGGHTRNGQPVTYGGNFELRKGSGGPKDKQELSYNSPRRNGSLTGDLKTDDLGRVLPARIQKNTLSRSYLPPTIPSTSPFMAPRQSIVSGGDVDIAIDHHTLPKTTKEEAEQIMRRSRIRRRWRCVLFVILASLIFALILVILLVFTTR